MRRVIVSILLSVLLTVSISGGACDIRVYAVPVVSVEPDSGPPKIWVYLNGTGFYPNDGLTIYFDDYIYTASADSSGSFGIWIQIPEGLAAGTYTILVMDQHGNSASTYFDVTTPRLIISPTSGPVGTKVSVSGTGLGENQYYVLKFDDIVLGAHLFYTLEDGRLRPEMEITIPPATKGYHNITLLYIPYYVDDVMTYEVIVSVKFYVTDGIALESDLTSINELIQGLAQDIQTLNTTVIDINSSLVSAISSLQTSITDVLAKLSAMNATIAKINATLSGAISLILKEISNIYDEIDALNSTLTDSLATLKNMINELWHRVSSGIENLNNMVKDLDTRVSQLSQSLATLKTTLSSSIEKVTSKLNEVSRDAAAKIESVNSKVESLEATFNAKTADLESSVAKLDAEIRDARAFATYIGVVAIIIAIVMCIPGIIAFKRK